ncbi:hypothetical protein PC116_g5976 [Phytophthora cactorum]|nr:hypothetical protein PC114_g3519 [Phytophthora cactorum]KAG3038188.1 hypothetical protein PC119_g3078 [Phytophthora cactorum]KAG4246263.1 hypothetical protein PC116_g5976 [Phytophthora cactorum]
MRRGLRPLIVSHVRTYVPTQLYSFGHQYIVLTEP